MSIQITCLYDMDLVFKPDGNFDEVYLYVGLLFLSSSRIAAQYFSSNFQEELMEADLHAIVSPIHLLAPTSY